MNYDDLLRFPDREDEGEPDYEGDAEIAREQEEMFGDHEDENQ